MNREQDFLKTVVILAAMSATSGNGELIVGTRSVTSGIAQSAAGVMVCEAAVRFRQGINVRREPFERVPGGSMNRILKA